MILMHCWLSAFQKCMQGQAVVNCMSGVVNRRADWQRSSSWTSSHATCSETRRWLLQTIRWRWRCHRKPSPARLIWRCRLYREAFCICRSCTASRCRYTKSPWTFFVKMVTGKILILSSGTRKLSNSLVGIRIATRFLEGDQAQKKLSSCPGPVQVFNPV